MSFQRSGAGVVAQALSDGASIDGVVTGATGSRILMPNGSLALPPYGFSQNLDTGLALVGGNVLSAAFGAAAIWEVIATRLRIPTGILFDLIDRSDGLAGQLAIERVVHGEVAAAVTIGHGASKASIIEIIITATGGADVTMTATPTIEAGTFDGQLCLVKMDPAATRTVTVTDEGTTAGTKLRLTATPVLIGGARDSMPFYWHAAASEWHAVMGARVNLL